MWLSPTPKTDTELSKGIKCSHQRESAPLSRHHLSRPPRCYQLIALPFPLCPQPRAHPSLRNQTIKMEGEQKLEYTNKPQPQPQLRRLLSFLSTAACLTFIFHRLLYREKIKVGRTIGNMKS